MPVEIPTEADGLTTLLRQHGFRHRRWQDAACSFFHFFSNSRLWTGLAARAPIQQI